MCPTLWSLPRSRAKAPASVHQNRNLHPVQIRAASPLIGQRDLMPGRWPGRWPFRWPCDQTVYPAPPIKCLACSDQARQHGGRPLPPLRPEQVLRRRSPGLHHGHICLRRQSQSGGKRRLPADRGDDRWGFRRGLADAAHHDLLLGDPQHDCNGPPGDTPRRRPIPAAIGTAHPAGHSWQAAGGGVPTRHWVINGRAVRMMVKSPPAIVHTASPNI